MVREQRRARVGVGGALGGRCAAAWVAVMAGVVGAGVAGARGGHVPPDLEDVPGLKEREERSGPRARPAESSGAGQSTGQSAGQGAVRGKEQGPPRTPGSGGAAVAFPHPMITEVLYAVPTGTEGDADQNGNRDATADEFVELYNPHDRAIDVGGYVLTDGTTGDARFRYVLPSVVLEPGDRAVVFNGQDGGPAHPDGSGGLIGAPVRHAAFHGAWVMVVRPEARGVAFANEGDLVLLSAPDGTAVHRVAWGSMSTGGKGSAGAGALLEETAPQVRWGSVQRRGVGSADRWAEHRTLGVPTASVQFSPGHFVVANGSEVERSERGTGGAGGAGGAGGREGAGDAVTPEEGR